MFSSRKIPRHQVSQYEDFIVRITPDKKKFKPMELEIFDISEEGCSVLISETMELDIADTVEGVVEDKKGEVLAIFTGFVVWKMENKLGIRFHKDIEVPERIIALEMSLID